jgi:hypothetical protein
MIGAVFSLFFLMIKLMMMMLRLTVYTIRTMFVLTAAMFGMLSAGHSRRRARIRMPRI